jgi:hypothetical protein
MVPMVVMLGSESYIVQEFGNASRAADVQMARLAEAARNSDEPAIMMATQDATSD